MAVLAYASVTTLLPVDDPRRTPGERMKQLRIDRGFSSLDKAAQACGLSKPTIQKIEDHGISTSQFDTIVKLSRGYGISVLNLQRIAMGLPMIPERTLEKISKYEVHPDWVSVPVYGVVSAGDMEAEPLDTPPVPIPREHLQRRGASVDTTRAYIVNGRCMISPEAMRVERTYAPGDYVAVDISKGYEPGDIVVAWWDDREMLVIKRYAYERENIALVPIAPGYPSIVLPSEDDLHILGPVVWRGG